MADDANTPGPVIATGRAAEIFDIGDGRVLRRYREARHRPEHEMRVMRYVADNGVRVPQVFDLGAHAGLDPERDIVMERIDGITLLEDLERRPWKLISHARLLARLQREIAAIAAPEWMMSAGWKMSPDGEEAHHDSVLHLDLHPMNVMLSRGGPVVIDWTNASGGPAGFDAAISYVEMATFEVEGPRDTIAAQVMVNAFKRARGAREVDAFLTVACDHRLADVGITPGERINVAALRKKAIERSKRMSARRAGPTSSP